MLIQKLTSRKFWTAISGIVIGCLMFFNTSQDILDKVSGLILILGDTIAYIYSEAQIDKSK